MAMWPLSTRVKRSRISAVGSPTMTVRVMSVVPSWYWPPESIRNSSPGAIDAVGLAGDAIVHDRAVRSGAGNGRERHVAEQVGLAAERFQRLDRADLGQLAARRFAIEPGEEARHRRAVAPVCLAGAVDLDRILHRLQRGDRIRAFGHLAAGAGDRSAPARRPRCSGRGARSCRPCPARRARRRNRRARARRRAVRAGRARRSKLAGRR